MACGDFPIPDCSRCLRPVAVPMTQPERRYKYTLVIEDHDGRRVFQSDWEGDIVRLLHEPFKD